MTAKRVLFCFFTILMTAALWMNAHGETIQDRIESRLSEAASQYQNSDDPQERQSIAEIFEQFGIDENALQRLTETDFARIFADLSKNMAIDDFVALAQEAFASGTDMLQDVINGGLGTSFGENTATTAPANRSTPLETPTLPSIVQQAATTTPAPTEPATVAPTQPPVNYPASVTSPQNLVGEGVTAPAPTAVAAVQDDGAAVNLSSMAVMIILSVATLAVIAAIIVFFVFKKRA